jgi:hypothetical protein
LIELAPGRHVVRIELDSDVRDFELEARHGRPLVVRMSGESVTGPELTEPPSSNGRRVEVDVQGGVYAHKLGGVFGRVGPSVTSAIRVGVGRERLAGFLGLRGEFYSTGWSSSSPNTATECLLPDRYRATAFAGVAGGGLTWDATEVVRTTIELTGGVEAFSAERGGGDVLEPNCSPSPGVVPLFAARAEVSFRIARAVKAADPAGCRAAALAPVSATTVTVFIFRTNPMPDASTTSPPPGPPSTDFQRTSPLFEAAPPTAFQYKVGPSSKSAPAC